LGLVGGLVREVGEEELGWVARLLVLELGTCEMRRLLLGRL